MKQIIFKKLVRGSLWAVSMMLLIFLFVQIALFSGVVWLKTEGGNRWLEHMLQGALKDSGYQLTFSRFDYQAPTRLIVSGLEISDQDGLMLKADHMQVGIALLPLAVKELALSFEAGHIDVLRFPEAQDAEVEQKKSTLKIAPFRLPDLYFSKLSLSGVNIDRLTLPVKVSGQPLILAPQLEGQVDLRDQAIDVQFNFEPGLKINVSGVPGDVVLEADAAFNPDNPALNIRTLALSSAAYEVAVKGDVDFNETQNIQLLLSGDISDLAALVPEVPGTAEFSLDIRGTQDAPLLNASATLSSSLLEEKKLSDIKLVMKSDNIKNQPQGRFEIATFYGGRPISVASDYVYDAPLVALKNIAANAPDITGAGALDINSETMKVDGEIKLAASNLQSYKDLLGQEIAGKIQAVLKLSHKNEQQAANLKATIEGFKYDDLRIKRLLAEASVADILNPLAVQGKMDAQELSVDKASFKTLALTIRPLSETDFSVSLEGAGQYIEPLRLSGTAVIKNVMSDAPELKDLDLSVFVKDHPARIRGAVSPRHIDMTLSANRFPLSGIMQHDGKQPFVGMDVSGAAKLNGSLEQPKMSADFSFTPLRVAEKAPEVKLDLTASYDQKYMQAKLVGRGKGIDTLNAQISLPMTFTLQPFAFDLPQTTPLTGKVNIALETATLAAVILPPAHTLTGQLQGNANISGTIAKPSYQGKMSIKGGQYENEAIGLQLKNILINGTFQDGPSIIISELSATDGGAGRLSGGGRIDLSGAAAQSDLTLKIQKAHLLKNEEIDGRLSADLRLSGQGQDLVLRGTITPDRLDINIPERFNSSIPQLNIVEPKKDTTAQGKAPLVIALDMDFIAKNQIFVRGWGLDAEVGGALDVTGTADAPVVNGNLGVLRGRYEEFTRRFKLTRANLRFQGKVPPSPYLDILAETDVDNITAQVNLTGRVTKPSIKFSSVPALPEDEVLSHILFGSEMRKITPFQAAQLAQTFRRLSGQGGSGFDPLATLRETTGLDDLRFETDDEGGASVGAGKYLTDKVYLEFKKGSGEQSGAANLQFELTPNIKAESEIGQDAKAGGGVYWQWDY